jgi:hypothetical protein
MSTRLLETIHSCSAGGQIGRIAQVVRARAADGNALGAQAGRQVGTFGGRRSMSAAQKSQTDIKGDAPWLAAESLARECDGSGRALLGGG